MGELAAVPAPPPAFQGTGLEGLATALAPQLAMEVEGQHEGGPQGEQVGELLQISDRLLSMASTSAAPVQLMPHTPMIGE